HLKIGGFVISLYIIDESEKTMQNGEIENKTVQMAVMYYVNNNIVIADAKTKKVYLTLNLDTNILVADANGWTKNYNLASLIAI
ncbi:hypothetical protein, partial [[Clostridium] symbiosum]|uniref:hypothetical protein n=1 Tax=Clostridium symbiosum TaxID=1512 RepID=UPI00319DDF9D